MNPFTNMTIEYLDENDLTISPDEREDFVNFIKIFVKPNINRFIQHYIKFLRIFDKELHTIHCKIEPITPFEDWARDTFTFVTYNNFKNGINEEINDILNAMK